MYTPGPENVLGYVVVETISTSDEADFIKGHNVTIDLSNPLQSNKNYYVDLDADAFRLASGSFSGISGISSWSFTTSNTVNAPTNLTVTSQLPTEVLLTWEDNCENETEL